MALPSRVGRFRIIDLLGQGAMGTVYRGRDEMLERDVAVKVMSIGLADADAHDRFLREARAAARLQHPNIVTIYELGEHEGSPFMALELLEGIDLQRAIEAGIRPDPKVTLPIVLQALAGLGHAHENGIVHRDVKPSNVFLPRSRPAKIMDFGVARLVGAATTKGLVVGTPNYMSPEQVRAGDVDGRSDLFSVGLILYELVTGEQAYHGDTVVSLLYKIVNEEPDLAQIPKGPQWEPLHRVLARSLAKAPADRYPDASAMGAELAEALRELGGSADWMTRSDQALMVRPRKGPREPESVTTSAPVSPLATPLPAAVPTTDSRPAADAAAPAPTPSRLPMAIAGTLGAGAVVLLALAVVLVTKPGVGPNAGASPRPGSEPASPASPTSAPAPTAPPSTASTSPSASPSPSATTASPPPATPSPAPVPPTTAPPDTVPPGPSPADARLDRANDFMEKGRYAQALQEARAVLARDPNNVEARALAGDAEAAILIEECVKKARAALKEGDRDRALEEIRRGLAVNPNEGRLLALHREATQ